MKRKIRRDARGTIYVDATVRNMRYDFRTGREHGCVKDAKVDQVRLGRTLRVGEAFYRIMTNRFVENDVCFDFESS